MNLFSHTQMLSLKLIIFLTLTKKTFFPAICDFTRSFKAAIKEVNEHVIQSMCEIFKALSFWRVTLCMGVYMTTMNSIVIYLPSSCIMWQLKLHDAFMTLAWRLHDNYIKLSRSDVFRFSIYQVTVKLKYRTKHRCLDYDLGTYGNIFTKPEFLVYISQSLLGHLSHVQFLITGKIDITVAHGNL